MVLCAICPATDRIPEPVSTRVARYRFRAEELRTLTDSLTSAEAKVSLLQMAFSYEQIAQRLEQGEQATNDPLTS